MYDPTVARTFQQDPMAAKYFSFSPYSWAANNPIIFIDPTGMVIEEGSQKEWDRQKGNVKKRRDKLEARSAKLSAKAEAKGWSGEKLAKKRGNINKRVSSLNSSLSTMAELENSAKVFSLNSGITGNGGVTYDATTGNVVIAYGTTANFVHESTHAGQFLAGHLAFVENGNSVGQDLWDEAAAYKAQFAYDPSSISRVKSSSVAKSFRDITPAWVKNIESDGQKIYAPGGSANTGQAPIDINSTRGDYMKAYPGKAIQFMLVPRNAKLSEFTITAPFEYESY